MSGVGVTDAAVDSGLSWSARMRLVAQPAWHPTSDGVYSVSDDMANYGTVNGATVHHMLNAM